MNRTGFILSAALVVGATANAHAQSGTITFNGEITSVTCDVSFNGTAGTNPTITLPKVATGSLTHGNSAALTPVTVHIGGTDPQCTTGSVALELNPNRNANVSAAGNLNNVAGTTPATDVVVRVRDSQDRALNLSTPWSSERVNLGAGGADIRFGAEYFAETANAGAGNVSANVQYTLDYN